MRNERLRRRDVRVWQGRGGEVCCVPGGAIADTPPRSRSSADASGCDDTPGADSASCLRFAQSIHRQYQAQHRSLGVAQHVCLRCALWCQNRVLTFHHQAFKEKKQPTGHWFSR